MMMCAATREALITQALRATDAAPSSAVAEHLRTCAACSAYRTRLGVTSDALERIVRDVAAAPLPIGLAARIVGNVRAPGPMQRAPRALAIVLALAAGFAALLFVPRHAPPSATLAQTQAIDAWHSPTAMLLHSREDIMEAPLPAQPRVLVSPAVHSSSS